MMRVLFVASRFPPDVRTGFSLAFSRLVQEARRHTQVRLVVGLRGARPDLPEGTLAVRIADHRLERWLGLWRAARAVVAEHRPHVVIVAGVGLPPVGCPVVAVVPDLSRRGWRTDSAVRPISRLAAAVPRAVVVPTEAMRAQVAAMGVRRWRVHRLPIGIDRASVPPSLPPRSGRLALVHPGTIHPSKGQHVSVDAVSRLPPVLRREVRLTVAGPVHDERYLAQLRGAAGGHPITVRTGIETVPEALMASHAALLPVAAQQGFPDQAVQALAKARPLVWSEVDAMPEVVGDNGLRVPPHDVPAVRDAIAELLSADLEALGHRGWQHAGAFTWERLWPQWATLLTGVARRAGQPTRP